MFTLYRSLIIFSIFYSFGLNAALAKSITCTDKLSNHPGFKVDISQYGEMIISRSETIDGISYSETFTPCYVNKDLNLILAISEIGHQIEITLDPNTNHREGVVQLGSTLLNKKTCGTFGKFVEFSFSCNDGIN